MAFGLLGIFFIFFAGFLVVFLHVNFRKSAETLLFQISLGWGIGIALAALFYLTIKIMTPSASRILIYTTVAIIISLIAAFFGRAKQKILYRKTFNKSTLLERILISIFSLSIILALIIFLLRSSENPHGEWDAWAEWNMHARFLFYSNKPLSEIFSKIPDWSHPDYPLLLPASIAQFWRSIGYPATIIPITISASFGISTILLLTYSLTLLRSRLHGLTAGIILSTTPLFLRHMNSQYADIPLGFYMLGVFVFLALFYKFSKKSFLIFAGLFLSLAAFTKNEGLLIAIIIFTIIFTINITIKARSKYSNFKNLIIGITPIILVLYLKIEILPSNYIVSSLGTETINRLLDSTRYYKTIYEFTKALFTFGEWIVNIPLMLIFYLLMQGIHLEDKFKKTLLCITISTAMILLGYFVVFIISPYNLDWHLNSSLDRLFLQLLPTVLFLYFMIIDYPERLSRKSDVKKY